MLDFSTAALRAREQEHFEELSGNIGYFFAILLNLFSASGGRYAVRGSISLLSVLVELP